MLLEGEGELWRLVSGERKLRFTAQHPDYAHDDEDSTQLRFALYRELGLGFEGDAPYVQSVDIIRALETVDRLRGANRRLQALYAGWDFQISTPVRSLRLSALAAV